MKVRYWFQVVAFIGFLSMNAQDTFSIVAVDSTTGEVGSAGASCVDLTSFPGFSTDFLGELFPNRGAINTQAAYDETNQANARRRMNEGDTPDEIINWLERNDVRNQPGSRQYGIVALVDGSPQSAAYTGANTIDYKNHVLGPNYSIQGNILSGQEVLDAMERNFLAEEGDLACRLMAALQGAKIVGADSRCASNGTSSLFAFIKVAQPTDVFGSPSFVQGVRTRSGSRIEPVDSLQVLFDQEHSCETNSSSDIFISSIIIKPNPARDIVRIENAGQLTSKLFDLNGKLILDNGESKELDISMIKPGIYIMRVLDQNSNSLANKRLIKTN